MEKSRLLGPYRLAWPRTPPFHGGDGGSNPPGDATFSSLKITLQNLINLVMIVGNRKDKVRFIVDSLALELRFDGVQQVFAYTQP